MTWELLPLQHVVLDPLGACLQMYKRIVTNKNNMREEGQVYKRQDLLLDLGGGESGERLEDELGLVGVLTGQTAARCGP